MVKTIKLLALDIDGVLTSGHTTLGARRPEKKRLAFQDLDAINAARRAGLQIALVTGESDGSVDLIAARTGVALIRRGAKDKLAALQSLARELQISTAEICYVGDGDRDAPALALVGLAFAPANATFAARSAAHNVLRKSGGHGAVNEAVRLLLNLLEEDKHEKIIRLELRRHFVKHKIALRHLPMAVNLAKELVRVFQTGRKILLCGENAENALNSFFASKSDWPAVALSNDHVVLAKQLRALAQAGDLVVIVGTNARTRGLTRELAEAKKRGATTLKIPRGQHGAFWPAAVGVAQKFIRVASAS
jgi:3-deoxy-D-manno-octulosonate 8-phosphate phosphatase (KDO 8-P phosphatase)